MSGKSAPGAKRRRAGRPKQLLDAENRQRILAALRKAIPLSTACWLGGISDRTASRWRLEGEKDEQKGRDTQERQFWRETSTAIAEGKALLAGWAFQSARFDGHLAVKLLERRDQREWAAKQELEPPDTTPLQSPRSSLLRRMDEIEKRLRQAREAGVEPPRDAPGSDAVR